MKKLLKKNLGKLLIAICIAFVSLGSNCTSKNCEPIHATDAKDALTLPAENLETDVFLDATLSMQGFVTEGSFSIFQQTIPILERAVIKNNGRIHFYKFGTNIKELPERSYSEFDKKSFYTDAELNRVTSIEKVLEQSDTNHLTIIVTDLFQEKADINQLSELIKKKFISNSFAVGILGVKSQFDGTVYDVGTNNYSFKYAGSGESSSFRPFYLIAFGKHADIARYFDTLVTGEMAGFPVKERIIFSRFLTAQPIAFDGAKITETKGANEVSGVLIKAENKDNIYREFKVKDNIETASFSADLPFQSLPNTVNFSDQLVSDGIEAFSCSNSTSTTANAGSKLNFVPNAENQSTLDIEAIAVEKQKIRLKIGIPTKKFESETIYGFHIILRPKEYSLPPWINEWNMTGEQIEAWRKNPASFDGTRTYNLLPFLQTLWETTRQVHNPKVADFYIYFRRG